MNPINYFKSGAWKSTMKVVGRKVIETRPELMLIAGGVSLLVGTVYACMKTPEAKEVIDATNDAIKAQERLDEVCEGTEKKELTKAEKAEKGKRYLGIYLKAGLKIGRIYAVPALLWSAGALSIFGAHKELRVRNTRLLANSVAIQQLFNEYRGRVQDAVGKETEEKIYLGAQEGMVQVIEKDPVTGQEKIVEKKADVFINQPGSIYARNFNELTCDAFDIRSYADYFLDSRVENIRKDIETGMAKFYSAAEILRDIGFKEDYITEDLIDVGITRKGPKLQVTRLEGYEKIWDVEKNEFLYKPCLRLDFNFYPLKGNI